MVGSWIIEIPEMQGHSKKDVDSLKSFLSKRQDKFRGAYKRYTQLHKRTCVIFGTTNEEMILRDLTGNRRFWILPCSETPTEDVWSLTQEEVQQIWAEAYQLYKRGETLYLDNKLKEELAEAQKAYDSNQSELEELAEWLDTPLPDEREWATLSKDERRRYFTNPESISPWKVKAPVQARQRVCPAEVINEYYGGANSMSKIQQSRVVTQMLQQLDGWRYIGRQRLGVYGSQTTFERITATPRMSDGLFELDNVQSVETWWQ